MGLLYGRAGRLTAENGGFWPGQSPRARSRPPCSSRARGSARWGSRVFMFDPPVRISLAPSAGFESATRRPHTVSAIVPAPRTPRPPRGPQAGPADRQGGHRRHPRRRGLRGLRARRDWPWAAEPSRRRFVHFAWVITNDIISNVIL